MSKRRPTKNLDAAIAADKIEGLDHDETTRERDKRRHASIARGSARDSRSDRAREREAEALRIVEESLTEIAEVFADKAKGGDAAAARIVFDYQRQASCERRIEFTLRPIEKVEDVPAAMDDVLQALARGEITLDHARQLFGLVRQIADMHELVLFGGTEGRRAYKRQEAERLKKARRQLDRQDQRDVEEMDTLDWDEEQERMYQDALAAAKAMGRVGVEADGLDGTAGPERRGG